MYIYYRNSLNKRPLEQVPTMCPGNLRSPFWGSGMVQWWEHLPPTNVAWVWFLALVLYVGWVCYWFSSLLWEVFLLALWFSCFLKKQYQCGPGLNPGLGIIHGLSFLLVLFLAPGGFSLGTLVFLFPQKTVPMWPGLESRTRHYTWVEFLVGSLPCSRRFFSGYSGFPVSSKKRYQCGLGSIPDSASYIAWVCCLLSSLLQEFFLRVLWLSLFLKNQHQCGPGRIPGLSIIPGLSLLLVVVLAPRGFSLGALVFPSPQKPTYTNLTPALSIICRLNLLLVLVLALSLVRVLWFSPLLKNQHFQISISLLWALAIIAGQESTPASHNQGEI